MTKLKLHEAGWHDQTVVSVTNEESCFREYRGVKLLTLTKTDVLSFFIHTRTLRMLWQKQSLAGVLSLATNRILPQLALKAA